METQTPPALDYADAVTRWGISLDRRRCGVRLVVPPIPGWRHLSKGYLTFVVPLFAAVLVVSEMATTGGGMEILPVAGVYLFIALAILAHAWWRMRQRIVIDITRDDLAL